MKYRYEIKKDMLPCIVRRLSDGGFASGDYAVYSYRRVDRSDNRTAEKRTVMLDDGTMFYQPKRRVASVTHVIETDNPDVACILRNQRCGMTD